MRWFLPAVAVALVVASGTVANAQGNESASAPSASLPPGNRSEADSDVGRSWAAVVNSARGPGTTWIEPSPGGVLAVLQAENDSAESWRSSDGVEWKPLDLPADLGTVSDVLPLSGGLALVTDEKRSDEDWTFSLWTSDDGLDWQLASSPSLKRHADMVDSARSILGFRSVGDGIVAFESYAPLESDGRTSPQALDAAGDKTGRVFVWHAGGDGRTWERREVMDPGREIISAGARILEDGREQLYVVQPGFPPRLFVSPSGVRWEDQGTLTHSLKDPVGAAAISKLGKGLLVAGRLSDGSSELYVRRTRPSEHWVTVLTLPDFVVSDLLVDRNVAVVAGTVNASDDANAAEPRRSFVAASNDRGQNWHEQLDVTESNLCLGPLLRIGDVALLGSGCSPTGGMSIFAARLDSFEPGVEPTKTSTVPSTPKALRCDFKRSSQDSGRAPWGEGEPGFDGPRDAMKAFVREGWVIPRSGYRELARDDTAVLYGYRNKGKVKVAVRVIAARGSQSGWVADRLSACRLSEFGRKAPMGPGVWLWANSRNRTIQERRGPKHCDWQGVRFLYWSPPGTPETLRATKLYLRDPRGIFRDQWAVPFLSTTTLPADARPTGFRRAGAALWLAADERAMYVKAGSRVERWPKVPSGIGCA